MQKWCAVEIQHTVYEVLQVRLNSLANSVVLYMNRNALHTRGEIRLKRSQYITAELTTQALSLSAFSLASIPFFTLSPLNTYPLPLLFQHTPTHLPQCSPPSILHFSRVLHVSRNPSCCQPPSPSLCRQTGLAF